MGSIPDGGGRHQVHQRTAVTMSVPWRPGRMATLSFGRVLVTGAGRRELAAPAG